MVRWPSASNSGATRARASVGPRREDRQLAVFRRILASRHRRVEQRHVRTLGCHQGRDAIDPGHADRAHLHPDRARSESSEHALVPGDRHDRIGVGHHRDDDRALAAPRRRRSRRPRRRARQGPGSPPVCGSRRSSGCRRAKRWPPSRGPSLQCRAPQPARPSMPSLTPCLYGRRLPSASHRSPSSGRPAWHSVTTALPPATDRQRNSELLRYFC